MSTINSDWLYKPNQVTTSSVRTPTKPEDMGMQDFLNLMMAQMTNQDIFNPQSDTEQIAQMAQFSSLQAMNSLLEHQLSSYSVSYVGKDVVIADLNERGQLERIVGTVERVTFSEGQPMLYVNGKGYELHKVMEIITSDYKELANKYLGKSVTISETDAAGDLKITTGTVEAVTISGGKHMVVVGGKSYSVDNVTVND